MPGIPNYFFINIKNYLCVDKSNYFVLESFIHHIPTTKKVQHLT